MFGEPRRVARATIRAPAPWEKRGLPVLALHAARHVFASFAIAAGVNAKALGTYMEHANIAITFDLYGHLMPWNESDSTGLLDAYFARAGDSTAAPTAAETAADTEKVSA